MDDCAAPYPTYPRLVYARGATRAHVVSRSFGHVARSLNGPLLGKRTSRGQFGDLKLACWKGNAHELPIIQHSPSRRYPGAMSTPVGRVKLLPGFWEGRFRIIKENALPAIYAQMKETGRWDSMKLQWRPGMPNKPHVNYQSLTIVRLMD